MLPVLLLLNNKKAFRNGKPFYYYLHVAVYSCIPIL